MEVVGDPGADPRQPFLASVPLPLRWLEAAQLVMVPEYPSMACILVGRLCGRLRPRPPCSPRQGAGARAHVLVGAVCACPPRRAGQHHGFLYAGQ